MSTSGSTERRAEWRGVAAALLAIFVGIGLSRFAYAPLMPAIVEAGWFSPTEAAYLGAANLAGYLIGALGGSHSSRWLAPRTALRGLMVLASLAFIASAFPLSFAWFFAWRFLSGVAGGALMVLAAPAVLQHVRPERRGLASGVIFTGVGTGIVVSGTVVPLLLAYGLGATWIALGSLSFTASALAWTWWPPAPAASREGKAHPPVAELRGRGLVAVYVSYGFIALGLVPHMVFLVDFVARGLGEGIGAGGRYWILFGIGALLGPLLTGRLADRFGFGAALRSVLLLHAGSVGLLVLDQAPITLALSSLMVGSAVSGTVPLVLGQTQERLRQPDAQKAAWGVATATFALGQAAGGYACSYLFARSGGDFEPLFLLGSVALLLALLINVLAGERRARATRGTRPEGRTG
jgi:predicted MFS family arabinose efflux permease